MNSHEPKSSPKQERLLFPRYGDFGYSEPVGKKHLSSKLSAIHKVIFNQEVKPPPRHVYNELKLSLKAEDLNSESSYFSSKSPQIDRNYSMISYPSENDGRHHRYDLMQRQSYEDSNKS
jgi:hypothetical protein